MSAHPDRWEKAAERDLARRQKAAGPLFAPLVEPKDPAEIRARAERHASQVNVYLDPEKELRLEAQAAIDRATVAAVVSPEELAGLDKIRSWCPRAAVYSADHWAGECRKRGLPWVGQKIHEELFALVDAAVAKLRAREAARAAAGGEQLDLPSGYRFEQDLQRIDETTSEEEAREEAAETEATIAALRAERVRP